MMKTAWKVLEKGMKSSCGTAKWKKGVWKEHKGDLELCNSGFHASKLLVDAIQFVTPGIICHIEYDGNILEEEDKFVARRMRVLKTYRFTKRMAVEFAIYCASSCLKNFEKEFPDDKRPREAILAAKRWLKNPSQKNKNDAWSAAWSAESATWSAAWSAESATWSAARSAWSAAWSAESATWSAARSAESAAWSAARSAWSAESAAWSAARSAESAESAIEKKKLLEKKLLKIIGAR
jgi:hypothetical protein